MDVAAALADPARSRIVELLSGGERGAGELAGIAAAEFGISQPATSRHLRILREAGLVAARVDGTRRIYALAPDGLDALEAWVARLRAAWAGPMLALETEIARGRRAAGDATSTDRTTRTTRGGAA